MSKHHAPKHPITKNKLDSHLREAVCQGSLPSPCATLWELIATNQSAFVAGRSVHDNFMLVQQTARHLHQLKAPRVLLKLDIAKAFDSVSWPFLLEILRHLGFRTRWREWVSILTSTASTRILINGAPGPPVVHECGLRQGDPVSPILFVVVIDVLNHMFQRVVQAGTLQRLTPRLAAPTISLFADDVVIFSHTEPSQLAAIQEILHTFGIASGLRMNFAKCFVTPIQCPVTLASEVAMLLIAR